MIEKFMLVAVVSYRTLSSVTCVKESKTRQSGFTGTVLLAFRAVAALSIDALVPHDNASNDVITDIGAVYRER